MIGLQIFRPIAAGTGRRGGYGYATWADPLPLPLAALAATGLAPTLADAGYQFPLVSRTGDKYKAFGLAERTSPDLNPKE